MAHRLNDGVVLDGFPDVPANGAIGDVGNGDRENQFSEQDGIVFSHRTLLLIHARIHGRMVCATQNLRSGAIFFSM